MKNRFTYNVFYKEDGSTFQEIMELVLINYVKKILNGDDCEMVNYEI